MAPGHRCCAVAERMVGDTTPTDASNVSALGNTAGVVCYKNIYPQFNPCTTQVPSTERHSIHTQTHTHTHKAFCCIPTFLILVATHV